MPRIRKKTSKRGTTHQREKIKRKVAETRRKAKKEGKKDATWKTKHPKDPGIPNNFPYKDQILTEIAETRRIAEEAKRKQKEDKKAAKAAASTEQNEDKEGSESGFDAVGTLNASTVTPKAKKTVAETLDEDDDVPVLINRDLPNFKAVLDTADVVLEVLDARDPLPFRSECLEKLVEQGNSKNRVVMVLNKIDTVPRESISSWAKHLRADHPTFLFRSASAFLPSDAGSSASVKGKAKAPVDDGVGVEALLEHLGQLADKRSDGKPLVVAVVGLANAGKSALINTLVKQVAFPTYRIPSLSAPSQGPTTTTYAQELTLSIGQKKIRFIDTPGLSWESSSTESEERRLRDILLRSRGRIDKLKDPEPAVDYIVKHAEHEHLMLLYNLPAFVRGDTKGFLAGVARANALIKKGGLTDHATAARIVLRDWSTGRFARYSSPPTSPAGQSVEDLKNMLETLKTRKEMSTSVSLVKMTSGTVEDRMPVLEENWVGDEGEGEDEEASEQAMTDEDEESGDDEADENEADGSDEDGEGDGSDEISYAPAPGKRKRMERTSVKTWPSKKVAFASLPKESKQSRITGSKRKKQNSGGMKLSSTKKR
ncbi:hypothetical protein NEOLEDRAFT_1172411 [Neolentinus lepideus HHB14362 ss-1]|uniref:P-loop containing nucleoside triphosphate hydrolase protein n=1 Tax=Neolentinus lepideus HHB14362 ss-1 TaxID=1314782 RepID=A0A165P7Y9_9AGAM|nr:hypothetical protein NEOLEDRAFT_1172411 [Neolentinus lepideus HHB14362 ss-1]